MNLGDLFFKTATEFQQKSGKPLPPSRDRVVLDSFYERNAALLASLVETKIQFAERFMAWARINAPDTSPSSTQALSDFADLALFSLLERGALTLVSPVPSEAEANLQRLRENLERRGLIPSAPPVAAVATATVEETETDLDKKAIAEWRGTSLDEVKRHMRTDVAFAARINRLMAEDRI